MRGADRALIRATVLLGPGPLCYVRAFIIGRFAHFGTEMPLVLGAAALHFQRTRVECGILHRLQRHRGQEPAAFPIRWVLNGIYPWEGPGDPMTGQVTGSTVAATRPSDREHPL